MEAHDITLVILSALFGLIASILSYLMLRQNKLEKEMDELREFVHKEVAELKTNYLSRFEDVKDNNNKQFTELKLMLQQIQDDQAKQTSFCNYIQEQKRGQ